MFNASHPTIHMVSAWASTQRLALAHVKVGDNTHEITAVPELLKLLNLEGAIVTADAMDTLSAIGTQIVTQRADYMLALKDNQSGLLDDLSRFV